MFARAMIDKQTNKNEINNILKEQSTSEDILSVVQHHDAISGTEAEYVAMDYSTHLSDAFS